MIARLRAPGWIRACLFIVLGGAVFRVSIALGPIPDDP